MKDFTRSLAYKLPGLAQEWDLEKNDRTPAEVTASNSYQAWWICNQCQHNWKQSVNNRKNGRGCPNCAGRVVHPGVNDFASVRPEYLSWWNDDKVDPTTILPGSRHIIQWKCSSGHVFSQPVRKFAGNCMRCVEKSIAEHSPHLLPEWDDSNPLTPSEVSYNSARKARWNCSTCQHTWVTPVYQRVNGSNCPKCSAGRSASQDEDNIVNFLVQNGNVEGTDFVRHHKGLLLGNLELDIYFPDRRIAIEYNGLYWHSEAAGKNKTYHYDKWKQCQDKGVQLITVWEDDYQRNPQLIHDMLLHKLGQTSSSKIYSRTCEIKLLAPKEAFAFLDLHHIQGKVQGSYYIGLTKNDVLVAVSVWTMRVDSLYLDRYATSQHVLGGLGKVLTKAITLAQGQVSQIVTFAANDISDGHLYARLGFQLDKTLKPDYSYLYNKQRVHKFNFRLVRFKKDPTLLYQEGLSESQLAKLNKIHRIWDSGKKRYVLPLQK